LEEQLGLGDDAANAMMDDSNPNWEDLSFADDIEVQKWAQQDDIENLEKLPSASKVKEIPKRQKKAAKRLRISMTSVGYRHIRLCLLKVMDNLEKKMNLLSNIPSWGVFVKKGIHHSQPHEFFTKEERLVWRIMTFFMSEEWFKLPGPAEWWDEYPENYYQKYWDIPSSKRFKEIAQLAFRFFFNRRMPKNGLEIVKKFEKL